MGMFTRSRAKDTGVAPVVQPLPPSRRRKKPPEERPPVAPPSPPPSPPSGSRQVTNATQTPHPTAISPHSRLTPHPLDESVHDPIASSMPRLPSPLSPPESLSKPSGLPPPPASPSPSPGRSASTLSTGFSSRPSSPQRPRSPPLPVTPPDSPKAKQKNAKSECTVKIKCHSLFGFLQPSSQKAKSCPT